jgi:site-specific recombinase XerD
MIQQTLPGLGRTAPSGAPGGLGWDAAIDLLVEGWAADHPGIRAQTVRHYRDQLLRRIAQFARARGIASVHDFDGRDLRAFVLWLDDFVTYTGRPLTPRGKQMALDTAKRFLQWLHQERLLPEDVTGRVGSYRVDRDLEPRATPGADLQRVLLSLTLRTPLGIRNLAMIHLMAFCGLRVSELVSLNASDLDLSGGRVRVRAETSKGRRTRFVGLPLTITEERQLAVKPEATRLMAGWLTIRSFVCPRLGEEDPFFVTLGPHDTLPKVSSTNGTGPKVRPPGRRMTTQAVRLMLGRAARRAGVEPKLVMPHRLRHYFGLTSTMAGVPTTALMRAMGHRSPIMTARYSQFADVERRWAFARADITKGISLLGYRLPGSEVTGCAAATTAGVERTSR